MAAIYEMNAEVKYDDMDVKRHASMLENHVAILCDFDDTYLDLQRLTF